MWAGVPECHLESHNVTEMLYHCEMRTAGPGRAADSQGCTQPVPWKLKLGRMIVQQMELRITCLAQRQPASDSRALLLTFAACGCFPLCLPPPLSFAFPFNLHFHFLRSPLSLCWAWGSSRISRYPKFNVLKSTSLSSQPRNLFLLGLFLCSLTAIARNGHPGGNSLTSGLTSFSSPHLQPSSPRFSAPPLLPTVPVT